VRSGAPAIGPVGFILCLIYFAAIGGGFMLLQIPFLQVFSVYLGHPTYTLAVILFSMILFAGLGSMLSDRIATAWHAWYYVVPLAVCAGIVALRVAIQPAIAGTIGLGVGQRCAVVVGLTAPLSMLLGFCFPLGTRLVGRLSTDATAWAWGVNGAVGVLASIAAVGVSLWSGIYTNFALATVFYAAAAAAAAALGRVQR
jgi:hypothetical protein